MNKPLLEPSTFELTSERQQRVEKIADRLRQHGTEAKGNIDEQARACRRVQELVNERTQALVPLTPLLVKLLQKEVDRTYNSVVEELYYQSKSVTIQRRVTSVLSEIADGQLLTEYQAADRELSRLIDTLDKLLRSTTDSEIRTNVLITLGRLALLVPQTVTSHITVAQASNIGAELLLQTGEHWRMSDAEQKNEKRLAILQLLSAFGIYSSDQIPDTDAVRAALKRASGSQASYESLIERSTYAPHCLLAVSILYNTAIDSEIATEQTWEFCNKVFCGNIRRESKFGTGRMLARETLGRLVALLPQRTEPTTHSKGLEFLRSVPRQKQTLALRILGTVDAAVRRKGVDDCVPRAIEKLSQEVQNLRGVNQAQSANLLGRLCLIYEPTDADIVKKITENSQTNSNHYTGETVIKSASQADSICRTIGFAVAYRGPNTETDVQSIQEIADKDINIWAGEAVGGMMISTDAADDWSPLTEHVRDKLREMPVENRSLMLRDLGIAVLRSECVGGKRFKESCVSQIRTTSGENRREIVRGLGTYMALSSEPEDPIIQSLIKKHRSTEGDTRRLVTETIGEYVTAKSRDSINTHDQAVRYLRTRVRDGVQKPAVADQNDTAAVASAVGHILAVRDINYASTAVESLVDARSTVPEADSEFKQAFYSPPQEIMYRAIGYLSAYNGNIEYVADELSEVMSNQSQRTVLAEVLGTIVGFKSDNIKKLTDDLHTRLMNASDPYHFADLVLTLGLVTATRHRKPETNPVNEILTEIKSRLQSINGPYSYTALGDRDFQVTAILVQCTDLDVQPAAGILVKHAIQLQDVGNADTVEELYKIVRNEELPLDGLVQSIIIGIRRELTFDAISILNIAYEKNQEAFTNTKIDGKRTSSVLREMLTSNLQDASHSSQLRLAAISLLSRLPQ